MNGYSKMKQSSNLQKPKSMDFSTDSDLFSIPQPHKNNEESKSHNIINKLHSSSSSNHIQAVEDDKKIDLSHLKSSGSGSGRRRRSFSVKLSKQSSGKGGERLSSAMKKVMPMGRSSSVSERYCRIVYDDFLEVDEEEEKEAETTSTNKKIKKMGNRVRIFKACKRIFGFKS